ncbi:MAG: transglutaminase family protein [Ramlibacter sp.]
MRFSFPPEPGQAPTDADLAATPDIQLTPAIRAKAAELGHNPVAIHNWVRNTVQWLPTWGSIQGADGTLKTLRGNAIDTASLTIALLRASGIPARYQFGTIDVPAEQAQNWVGGVSQPEAALNLLYQGGIAARGIANAGRIRTIRMEHAWVSAYVNWIPSRGAKDGGWDLTPKQHPNPNAQLNAWVPLDVSYKQYVYTTGMNLQANVPLDSAALLAAVQQGATVTPHYTQNLNQANLQAQLASYQNQVKAYINSTPGGASATVGDVLGNQRIQTRNFSMLPGTLAYPLVVLGNQRAELPDEMRWKITFKLYASANNKRAGQTLISHQLPLTAIGTRRISVAAVPATPADQELLASYTTSNATSLPVYLIRQKVQLKLDDQLLAHTEAQQMGAAQWWDYVLEGPNFDPIEEDFKYETAVGDAIVFGVNGAGISFEQIATRFHETNPNTAHENLQHLALGYFARADWSDQALAALHGYATTRLPSVGLFASPLSIRYSWGVAHSGTFKSYALDIRRLTQTVESKASIAAEEASTARVNFNVEIGLKNSYLEGAVFEEVFDLSSGRGLSAVALLKEANENGLGIHSITEGNLAEFLNAAVGLSADIRNAINAYVQAGFVVLAPDGPVDAVNWQAQGYIAIDPQTGSGAYIIGTGLNGGELLECEEKTEPLTKSLGSKVQTLLVIAAAAALIAAGLAVAPPSGGTSLGGTGVVVAQLMKAIGMTTLVFSANANAGQCKSDKCHRGRFQAQGGRGALAVEKSVKWELPNPLTKADAFRLIDELMSQLTTRQLEVRATGFAEMKARIAALDSSGVCARWTPSFPKEGLPDGVRADIEVTAGQAFVD